MSSNKAPTELKSSLDFNKTAADRFATTIASAFGSITFLIACIAFFIAWAIWNGHPVPEIHPFDHFPFPILDTMVSLFAVILSVSVLKNQNRQGKTDKNAGTGRI